MSRYIDYNAIDYRNDKMHGKSSDFLDGVVYMAQRIEEAPHIDIVRCKECKRSYIEGQTTLYRVCGLHDITTDENNYCSWAEREGE